MISVEQRGSHVIEIRAVSPIDDETVETCAQKTAELLGAAGARILVVDLRDLHVMKPAQLRRIAEAMRADNPRVERSAFLLPRHPTSRLQIERMIREASNPARQPFEAVADVLNWLGEIITPEERAAIAAFYARG